MHEPQQSVRNAMNQAVAVARTLEQLERSRGHSAAIARRALSARLSIGVGTFRNLVYDRVKSVDAAIRDRLQALLIQELEHEILRLSHELEIARQSGAHPACEHVGEIEAHLAKARALLVGRR